MRNRKSSAKHYGTLGIGFSTSLSCFACELWLFALFLNVVGVCWSDFIPELYVIAVEGAWSLRFLLPNVVFVAVTIHL